MAEQNLNILVRVEGAKAASAEISGISKATESVGKQTETTSKKTSNLRKTLGGLATGFAVYKGAQWIKGAVTETTELAKSTAGLSRITGMDAGTASAWVALAKERGIQARQLNMGFITLAKQSQKLSEGNKKAAETFARLGVTAKQWQSLNTEQRMELLAQQFQKMRNPTERAAIAQTLFGRSAQALIPLLSQGKTALAAHIAEQRKATGENATSLREQMKLVAEQREMNRAMLQLKIAVATALMPIMLQFTKILAPLTSAFASLMQKSGAFRIAVVALTAAFVVFIGVMKLASLAEIAALAGIAPWLAITVGVALVFVMLYQKVKVFRDAVNAVWTWIKAHWPLLLSILLGPIATAVILIIKHWNFVKAVVASVFNWIKTHWPLLASILGGPFAAAAIQIIKHWHDIENAAQTVFHTLSTLVHGVAGTIAGVLGGAFKFVKEAVESLIGALGKAVSLAEKVASVPGKIAHTATFGVFQSGGYAHRPMSALVGERGPEMVHLPQGARVSPLVQSYRGGQTVVNGTFPIYLDRRQIALAMGSFVADQQAAR